jgi:K+-transporting ATPase ATPase B chain
MTTRKRYIKLFDPELVGVSIKQSFVKLNPVLMIKNPVMFTVEIVTAVMFAVCIYQAATGDTSQGALWYNIVVFLILLVTVLFANFAEALAEARGKAQAESLRKTREETPAKKMTVNGIKVIPSSQLGLGDHFVCETGDIIPMDGEIIEGIATIDESAITG